MVPPATTVVVLGLPDASVSVAPDAAEMRNASLVALVRPAAVADSVYVPARSSLAAANGALPLFAASTLPVSDAPLGPLATASVTWFVAPPTTLPNRSCTWTLIGGAIATLDAASCGCAVNA